MAMLPKVIFCISFNISILLPPPTEAVHYKRYLTCLPAVLLLLSFTTWTNFLGSCFDCVNEWFFHVSKSQYFVFNLSHIILCFVSTLTWQKHLFTELNSASKNTFYHVTHKNPWNISCVIQKWQMFINFDTKKYHSIPNFLGLRLGNHKVGCCASPSSCILNHE